jgi:hypothetical protein
LAVVLFVPFLGRRKKRYIKKDIHDKTDTKLKPRYEGAAERTMYVPYGVGKESAVGQGRRDDMESAPAEL